MTPTGSLRWRVTAAAVVVVALAFLVVGTTVELALGAQLRRDAQSRLDDRVTRATSLVAQGVAVSDLPALVDGQGIRGVVLGADGRRLVPASDPEGTRAIVRATARPRAQQASVPLAGGARLVLAVDPAENAAILSRLQTVMVVVGAIGLVLTAAALLGGVRLALRPLDALTGLARATTSGDRGRRLRPDRPGTELGRTAQAFDEMLDALDAAQARAEAAATEARHSEETTRHFLSDAAHELRTPLTGVQSLAESLVRRPDADLAHRERVATTLVRETRRAGALVADMLELARIEGGPDLDRRRLDLADLAAAEVERARLLAPGVDVAVAGGPAPAVADGVRVTQILANLLDNARRHTAGTIAVTTGVDDALAWVEVADDGAGVAEPDRERVFDRLVRLDDARDRDSGGAGLGLAIARGLARAHGGDLRIVDGSGVPGGTGARFRLTLPAAP